MSAFFTGLALLPGGWAKNVRIEVDASGVLSEVSPGASDGDTVGFGPGDPRHPRPACHAFQRAMAGLTERRRHRRQLLDLARR